MRIHVGSVSPDGQSFVSRTYNEGGYLPLQASIRNTESGEIEVDLTPYRYNGDLSWSSDGNKIAGLFKARHEYKLIALQLRPAPRIVDEITINPQGLRDTLFDSQGNLCAVISQTTTTPTDLQIHNSGGLAVRLPFGKDEFPQVRPNSSFNEVDVLVHNNTTTGTTGDLVYCDTNSSYINVVFDPSTGEVLQTLSDPFQRIPGTKNLAEKLTTAATEIHDVDSGLLVRSLPPSATSLYASKHYVIAFDTENRLSFYPLPTGQARALGKNPNGAAFTQNGEMISFSDGELYREDLSTGERTVLQKLNRDVPFWKPCALGGLALLVIAWLAIGWRSECRYPFADMLALTMVVAFVLITWAVCGVREFRPEMNLAQSAIIVMGAAMTIGLVWASTKAQFWGTTLTACVTAVAMAVAIFGIWSNRDSYRIVELLVGSGIGLTWHVSLLFLLRKFVGPIERETEQPSNRSPAASQVSLRQGLVTTAAFCAIFALVRSVNFQTFFYDGVGIFLLWLVIFTSKIAISSIVSAYSAIYSRHWLPSFCLPIVCSVTYSSIGYVITRNWNVYLALSPLARCLVPVATGLTVWLAMRYCRWHGYRITRRDADQSQAVGAK